MDNTPHIKPGSDTIIYSHKALSDHLNAGHIQQAKKALHYISAAREVLEAFPKELQSNPAFWTLTARVLLLKLDVSHFTRELEDALNIHTVQR